MSKTPTAIPVEGGYVVKRTPGFVHGTFESAGAEAVRLTEQMPDSSAFMVLKVVGMVANIEAQANG